MSYRSHADLGGRAESGAIVPEPEGGLFHAPWEPRVLALTLAMGATGLWNLDMSRAVRETLPDYRNLSYYEIWLAALEKLVALHAGAQGNAASPPRVLHADQVPEVLARGTPYTREATQPARYAVGQRVCTCTIAPAHHTRLPGYARGKPGVIQRVHGVYVFADSNAQGLGECPQWLYSVAFEEQALWGGTAAQGAIVAVDAWEPYLLPVSAV